MPLRADRRTDRGGELPSAARAGANCASSASAAFQLQRASLPFVPDRPAPGPARSATPVAIGPPVPAAERRARFAKRPKRRQICAYKCRPRTCRGARQSTAVHAASASTRRPAANRSSARASSLCMSVTSRPTRGAGAKPKSHCPPAATTGCVAARRRTPPTRSLARICRSSASCSKSEAQLPAADCLTSRTLEYQIDCSPCKPQRQLGICGKMAQAVTPRAPARCTVALPTEITRSRAASRAANPSRSTSGSPSGQSWIVTPQAWRAQARSALVSPYCRLIQSMPPTDNSGSQSARLVERRRCSAGWPPARQEIPTRSPVPRAQNRWCHCWICAGSASKNRSREGEIDPPTAEEAWHAAGRYLPIDRLIDRCRLMILATLVADHAGCRERTAKQGCQPRVADQHAVCRPLDQFAVAGCEQDLIAYALFAVDQQRGAGQRAPFQRGAA